nr:unnamed protein product [Digitaria exilis]
MDFGGMKRPELQALCKRHGLPAGGTNADLVARLDAALSGGAEAEEEAVLGVATRKGCLKRPVGDAGEAKKVTFAVQESRGRRLRSRVVWSPVVSKTRGKRAEAGVDSAPDDGISADAGANVPVRRSRRNSLTAADAEEIEAAVTVDRKRKCKDQEIAEDAAANAPVVPSRRVTRRSSLSGNAVLLPPAVEKKMGREKAADGKNKLAAEEQVAEAQDSSAATTVVENKRSRRKRENCDPDVQKSAKVEAPSRTTRSRSVEAALMSPTVVENKRRKTGDGQPDVELPTVSEVVKKDAPVTRSLRNRVVQVNNPVVEETRTSQQLENKAQPSRPATRRHKQVESSVEEEDQEQVAVPNKAPLSRRSGRNNSEASNANSENNKLVSALVEAKDLQVAYPLTRRNAKAQDAEKQPIVKEPVRRSTRKSVVSIMLDSEDKDPTEEKNPEAPVRRSMRRSVVPAKDVKGAGEEIQHAKGEDAVKQPAITEPVRRSTRKSVVSTMLDSEDKDPTEEKNPEAPVMRSMRRSVVSAKDVKVAGEEIQHAKGEDAVKQPAITEPVRQSTRKSLASAMHEKEENDLSAEKNPGAHVRRSSRKSVVPVKDVGEDIQNTKGEDAEKQLSVKQPVRRSSRKSVLPDTLENESGFIVAETNAEAHARRSTRKSVLPNMINTENPDLSKMARNGNFETGKCEDDKQQIVNEPVRRLRRSVVTVTIEEPYKGLHYGNISKIPMRRLTRKSIAFNVVEKGSMDNTEKVGMEESEAGTRKPKVRDHGVAMVISGNDSQAVLQRSIGKSSNHYLSDDNETQPGSEKCMSRESVGEDVMKLRNHRRSSMEISSSAKDSSNIEDFSGQKFRKQQRSQTPIEKGDTGANYDRQLRTQQASHSTTSKERSSKRRWTTAPEEVTSAEEANDVMVIREATEDTCKVSHVYCEPSSRIQEICQVNATGEEYSSGPSLGTVTLPDEICSTQSVHEAIPGSESSEAAKESLDKSKQPQEHTAIQHDDNHLSETRNEELDQSSSVAELHSGFVLEDKTLMGEAEFAVGDGEGQSPVAGHGSDTASGSALPTSDNNPEIHCDVITEESIRADDLGRCPSMDGKGNLLTNLHSEGAADNSILPALNAAKGCSSDERHSSFGLEVMFTEASKDTAVEVDGGNKSITCLTPGFHVGSDCGLEDEDVIKEGINHL